MDPAGFEPGLEHVIRVFGHPIARVFARLIGQMLSLSTYYAMEPKLGLHAESRTVTVRC